MIRRLTILILLWLPLAVYSQDTNDKKPFDIDKLLYGDLKNIKYFGLINVYVEGTDIKDSNSSDSIGNTNSELTEFLKLRFKNNFANIPYKRIDNPFSLPESQQQTIGWLWCHAWAVGNDYPVAYYIECQIGTVARPQIDRDAHLGYGNASVAKEEIKKSIDQMTTNFAEIFFKVRGDI